MARTADIVSAISATTGKRVTDVDLSVRRLREADLWVRETKSPRSPRQGARQVAHLVIGLLSGAPAKHIAEPVQEAADECLYQMDHDVQEGLAAALKNAPPGAEPLRTLLRPDHSIVDAIEAIITVLEADPGYFGLALGDPGTGDGPTEVLFDQVRRSGEIYLSFEPPGGLNQFRFFSGWFQYLNARRDSAEDGDLVQTARLTVKTLLAGARTLARDHD